MTREDRNAIIEENRRLHGCYWDHEKALEHSLINSLNRIQSDEDRRIEQRWTDLRGDIA